MDVRGLWTMGHGGGSGQNRLSSVLWSEAQTWIAGSCGCEPNLGLLFFLLLSIYLAQRSFLRQAQVRSPVVKPRREPCPPGLESRVLRLLDCQVPFRTGHSAIFQPFHLCTPEQTARPKEGASSLATFSLIFLCPLGAVYAWVEGVITDHTYGFSSPKFIISTSQSIYLPSPLRDKRQLHYLPFSARAFWGEARRQARVGSVELSRVHPADEQGWDLGVLYSPMALPTISPAP